jgi:hypothetical protein
MRAPTCRHMCGSTTLLKDYHGNLSLGRLVRHIASSPSSKKQAEKFLLFPQNSKAAFATPTL